MGATSRLNLAILSLSTRFMTSPAMGRKTRGTTLVTPAVVIKSFEMAFKMPRYSSFRPGTLHESVLERERRRGGGDRGLAGGVWPTGYVQSGRPTVKQLAA